MGALTIGAEPAGIGAIGARPPVPEDVAPTCSSTRPIASRMCISMASASVNIAPLCRCHHRYKTHGGWTVTRTGPTSFTWTSRHGYSYDWDTRHAAHTRHMR